MRRGISERTGALDAFSDDDVAFDDDRTHRHVTLFERRSRQFQAAPHVSFMCHETSLL